MQTELPVASDGPALIAQLEGLLKYARIVSCDAAVQEVKREYRARFDAERLRLRPSVGGFSVVSCLREYPQIGFGGIKTADKLRRELKKILKEPGRNTPEKRLQSWLLDHAALSGGELTPIANITKCGEKYLVVSDEIKLEVAGDATKQKKFLADMLLVKVGADGVAQLVNVELKSARDMNTFKQVRAFRRVLEIPELRGYWQEFASIMTGGMRFNWQGSLETRGIVIWKALRPNSSAPSSTTRKQQEFERMEVIGYNEDDHALNYTLELEKRL